MKHEKGEHEKQVDQEKNRLNDQSIIFTTSGEEMRQAHILSYDNSLSDERQSI
jgi:hypothetical protein